MKNLISVLLGLAGVIVAQGAIAQIEIYSKDNLKVPSTAVIVGFTPGQSVQIGFNAYPISRNNLSPTCGLIKLSSVTPIFRARLLGGSSWIEVESLPVQTLPSCTNGVLAEPRTAIFKTDDNNIYIPSSVPSSYQLLAGRVLNRKANACGMIKLTIPRDTPPEWVYLTINGQQIYFDDGSSEIRICRKIGGQSVIYRPLAP
ncbi:MAG TPA: hypothetical protein VK211_29150 [Kamptonema sp.]|nr:hypothetical protein [Kamptonema sp.]